MCICACTHTHVHAHIHTHTPETFNSVAQLCLTFCDPMDCMQHDRLPIHHQLKLMSFESVMPSNHLILCHPLLFLPFPRIRVFSNESIMHIRWPKYWNFSFSISLSDEYSGLISFRIDCFDLLAVQGTLRSLLQQHSSNIAPSSINSFNPTHTIFWGFLRGSAVKNLPAVQEMEVPSLGREYPLEKDMATHFSILAWEITWTEEPRRR